MMVICNKNDKTHLVFTLYGSEAIALESSLSLFIYTKKTSQSISVSVLFKEDNCSQFINPPHSSVGVAPVSLQCWCRTGVTLVPPSGVTPVPPPYTGVTPVSLLLTPVSLRCLPPVSLRCLLLTPVSLRCLLLTPVSLRCLLLTPVSLRRHSSASSLHWCHSRAYSLHQCHSGVTPVLV